MKTLSYVSKTHGKHTIKLDNDDYGRVKDSGKWCVVIKRDRPYFQKRVDYTHETRGRIIELHRWLMGEPEGLYIDHINGDTLDNRRSNLRAIKNSTNIRNGKVRTNNKSGVTGVRFRADRNKWCATIRVDYKVISLGHFKLFEDAVVARKRAEEKYFDV